MAGPRPSIPTIAFQPKPNRSFAAPYGTWPQHSAGFSVRFVTGATTISARWTLRNKRLEMPHMPATGVSGIDLYVKSDGRWNYLGTGRPTQGEKNESVLVRDLEPSEREFRIYFPLYNGIEKLEIGIPEAAMFKPAPPLAAGIKPIVFYGTSITQGGCASRPAWLIPQSSDGLWECPSSI